MFFQPQNQQPEPDNQFIETDTSAIISFANDLGVQEYKQAMEGLNSKVAF